MSDQRTPSVQVARGRHEHRDLDKHGACTRCGCSPRYTVHCPPGFWMTPAEHAQWDALDRLPEPQRWHEQAKLTKRLIEGVQS